MNKSDILHLLEKEPLEALFRNAEKTLRKHKGSHVNCRGLIEFSNICRRNCLYCGLAVQNKKIRRYRLTQAEIMESAQKAAKAGVDTIVLQSGEGATHPEWLAEVITEIATTLKLPVTLSVGEWGEREYSLWRLAGASRFLLKHETASDALYSRLHPGHALKNRICCLETLASLDYEIGDGFMVGLPGQTLASYADDILLAQKLNVAMCGVGPFIPHQQTALANEASGSTGLTLRIIAILRLALPNANLPATTALATLDPQKGQIWGLKAGANVLMPSFTPEVSASSYAIYDNKHKVSVQAAISAIEEAGRTHALKLADRDDFI